MSTEKFNVPEGEDLVETHRALDDFLKRYTGIPEGKSSWRVLGKDEKGNLVFYWINQCEEEEFAARKIAQLINRLGGKVRADKPALRR